MLAAVLAATRPDAAAIIQGAAQAHAVGVGAGAGVVQLSSHLGGSAGRRGWRAGAARPRRDMDSAPSPWPMGCPAHRGPKRT